MRRTRETSKRSARVLIVDDHPAVREALAMRISTETGLKVCGEAADVAEALQVVEATDPDVAVIDIALKTGDGIDLIRRIKARNQRIRILVWSMYGENLYAERALRAGAMGYLDKEQATRTIIEAIRQVLDGKVYLSSAMTEKLLRRSVGQDPGRLPIDSLSDRELEVFRLIGQGVKTQEIAAQNAPEPQDGRNLPRPNPRKTKPERWLDAGPKRLPVGDRELIIFVRVVACLAGAAYLGERGLGRGEVFFLSGIVECLGIGSECLCQFLERGRITLGRIVLGQVGGELVVGLGLLLDRSPVRRLTLQSRLERGNGGLFPLVQSIHNLVDGGRRVIVCASAHNAAKHNQAHHGCGADQASHQALLIISRDGSVGE